MGRSVSYPSYAEWTVYMPFEYEDPDDACWEWDDFKDNLAWELKDAFPSLYDEDKWDGNECHGFLSNRFGTFYLAEYCGLVSLSFKLDDLEANYYGEPNLTGLGENWAANAEDTVLKVMAGRLYRKIATASNGEAFYEAYPS